MDGAESTVTQLLFETYGPTIGMKELATVLKKSPKTVDNLIRAGRCPIPTYREGGHRVASTLDVAEYLDARRQAARNVWEREQATLERPIQASCPACEETGACTASASANQNVR